MGLIDDPIAAYIGVMTVVMIIGALGLMLNEVGDEPPADLPNSSLDP